MQVLATGLRDLRLSRRAKAFIGITDSETVKLDLDNMGLEEAKYWASKTCREFKLGDF